MLIGEHFWWIDEPVLPCAPGWKWHNISVRDFAAPTVEQIAEFVALTNTLLPDNRVLVHCRAGIGRTATMAAAYWIGNGLSAQAAIEKIRERRPYAVENRQQEAVLLEFERWRQEYGR